MLKFKIGDKVSIGSGKDKGRDGKIEKVLPKVSSVIIPGLNEFKKHIKPGQGQKGGIMSIPRPIAFSKLQLICPNCGKVTRVGFRLAGKEKVRFCRKCNKEITVKK